MSQITLTDQQWSAVKTIVEWFHERAHEQQVARIWGYAGCGKSTVTR